MKGGMFFLRMRCLGRPAVVRTYREIVRGWSDVEEGSIVLLLEERPWPLRKRRPIRYAMRVASARAVRDRAGVELLEITAAAVWPLAQPFHLADVLGDEAQYEGPSPIQRLSNLHEQAIRRSDRLGEFLMPVERRKMDEPVRMLILRLWTKGADGPGYDKGEWNELRRLLAERGIET